DRNFYFLEMNTRLQVEHPVTECITGLDLVEQMIRVANGEKLSFTQEDVKLEGWAVETRIYAEDPYRGFLPSTGRLVRYRTPEEVDGVRIDTGVGEGAEISMFYDPMIAKLVTSGANRAEAIDKMARALDRFRIRGVGHNVEFLAAVMAHPRFREGRLSTGFIAEEFPSGFEGAALSEASVSAMYAVVAAYEWAAAERDACISGQVPLARRSEAGMETDRSSFIVRDGETQSTASVTTVDGGYDVLLNGEVARVRGDCGPTAKVFEGTVKGTVAAIQVERDGASYRLVHGGAKRRVQVVSSRVSALLDLMPVKQAPDMSRFLLSPMPGLLVSVAVAEGESVKAGQELAVVEAMKMENVMRAERDGVVSKVHAAAGSSLAVDQEIIEFE
ncbi:MAG: acetyl/propionyl-CoA carboxylase subunit alpha, partial [Alphaproteobacteria bacterium]|nr:acetyl/propionyl-CoA carboxylase subunit alpha [Alphaproteobacteria bacterium]